MDEKTKKLIFLPDWQCDQIWRNFATLAEFSKSLAIFEGLFRNRQNIDHALVNI